ncbi:hypothetical protein SSS_05310 [Sarcoptes scabiei]|uniref:Gustatory receptor n=1 Tax=Sarcoptes scabiei TaxID=52283 RepID=A0A834R8C0_SARSC|nr:hypothetical protein SSS_05310 [Sarcoptes scabiei]
MPESIEMLPAEVISIDNKNLDVDDEDGGNDANQSFKSDQRAKQNLNHQNVSRKNLADELQLGPKIFSIILPFIFVGCPFNHCFPKSFNPFVNSIGMKIYTILTTLMAHSILIGWFIRIVIRLFTTRHLNDDLLEDIFILSYIVAGIIGLDSIWLNRKSILSALNLIDSNPFTEELQYKSLIERSRYRLERKEWKFRSLLCFSYLIATLLFFYYGYLATIILQSFWSDQSLLQSTSSTSFLFWQHHHSRSPDVHPTIHWIRTMRIITVYALYFFISDAILLLSLVWSIQIRIKHLNSFIKNLIFSAEQSTQIDDIEIIKIWFQNIKLITKRIDQAFSFYMAIFIGFLFFAIIFFVSKTLDQLKTGHGESVRFVSMLFFSILLIIILLYGVNELSNVHHLSARTQSILFDHVLITRPDQRSTLFYEEINFVVNGLLSNPASFTLFGQIELNRNFLVRIIMIVYSYAIIFNQFERSIPKDETNQNGDFFVQNQTKAS